MKKLTFAIIALLGMGFGASAQSNQASQDIKIVIDPVAKLAFGATPMAASAQFSQNGDAGTPISTPTVDGYNLVYSSIVDPSGGLNPSRTISVSATGLVPGVNVFVAASAPIAVGGNPGVSVSAAVAPSTIVTPVAVTSNGNNLITGIGSCYTGTGITNAGTALTYTFTTPAATYGDLTSTIGKTVTVTYTLTPTI